MGKIFLVLVFIISFNADAQNKQKYSKIDKMDRSAIIKLAKEKINEFNKLLNDSRLSFRPDMFIFSVHLTVLLPSHRYAYQMLEPRS